MEDDASRAKRYRDKAEELQTLARHMSTNEAKKLFVQMALDYLHMAETIERLGAEKSDSQLKL